MAWEGGIGLYFSPNGHCTDAIVEQIAKATVEVKIQAYRLTSIPIAKAIADAHKRNVLVTIILDGMQQSEKYSDATYFHNLGIPVAIDTDHAIAHNKIILIDGATVITGSFNFSANAETSNAETLLVIEGKPLLAAAFLANFDEHLKHSLAYRPPAIPVDATPVVPTRQLEPVEQ